jgi:4-hydroxy-2-oxoheptanedioate aldolase
MRKNKVKEKLLRGEPVLGIWQSINSMDLAEMSGYSGYDFVIFDTEHGPMSAESCIPLICAAERTNIVPIIRVSEIQKTYILKALDVGAMGIIFPMVSSYEEAKKAVSLSKYILREGEKREEFRGLISVSRAAGYGLAIDEKTHLKTSNKEIMLIVQFETKEAVDNLDEILKLEEIDVVFIGSYDLSQSLGFPGEINHPMVKNIIEEAIKKIVNSGKAAGVIASSPDSIKYWIELGVKFITCHQTMILSEALGNFVNSFNKVVHN